MESRMGSQSEMDSAISNADIPRESDSSSSNMPEPPQSGMMSNQDTYSKKPSSEPMATRHSKEIETSNENSSSDTTKSDSSDLSAFIDSFTKSSDQKSSESKQKHTESKKPFSLDTMMYEVAGPSEKDETSSKDSSQDTMMSRPGLSETKNTSNENSSSDTMMSPTGSSEKDNTSSEKLPLETTEYGSQKKKKDSSHLSPFIESFAQSSNKKNFKTKHDGRFASPESTEEESAADFSSNEGTKSNHYFSESHLISSDKQTANSAEKDSRQKEKNRHVESNEKLNENPSVEETPITDDNNYENRNDSSSEINNNEVPSALENKTRSYNSSQDVGESRKTTSSSSNSSYNTHAAQNTSKPKYNSAINASRDHKLNKDSGQKNDDLQSVLDEKSKDHYTNVINANAVPGAYENLDRNTLNMDLPEIGENESSHPFESEHKPNLNHTATSPLITSEVESKNLKNFSSLNKDKHLENSLDVETQSVPASKSNEETNLGIEKTAGETNSNEFVHRTNLENVYNRPDVKLLINKENPFSVTKPTLHHEEEKEYEYRNPEIESLHQEQVSPSETHFASDTNTKTDTKPTISPVNSKNASNSRHDYQETEDFYQAVENHDKDSEDSIGKSRWRSGSDENIWKLTQTSLNNVKQGLAENKDREFEYRYPEVEGSPNDKNNENTENSKDENRELEYQHAEANVLEQEQKSSYDGGRLLHETNSATEPNPEQSSYDRNNVGSADEKVHHFEYQHPEFDRFDEQKSSTSDEGRLLRESNSEAKSNQEENSYDRKKVGWADKNDIEYQNTEDDALKEKQRNSFEKDSKEAGSTISESGLSQNSYGSKSMHETSNNSRTFESSQSENEVPKQEQSTSYDEGRLSHGSTMTESSLTKNSESYENPVVTEDNKENEYRQPEVEPVNKNQSVSDDNWFHERKPTQNSQDYSNYKTTSNPDNSSSTSGKISNSSYQEMTQDSSNMQYSEPRDSSSEEHYKATEPVSNDMGTTNSKSVDSQLKTESSSVFLGSQTEANKQSKYSSAKDNDIGFPKDTQKDSVTKSKYKQQPKAEPDKSRKTSFSYEPPSVEETPIVSSQFKPDYPSSADPSTRLNQDSSMDFKPNNLLSSIDYESPGGLISKPAEVTALSYEPPAVEEVPPLTNTSDQQQVSNHFSSDALEREISNAAYNSSVNPINSSEPQDTVPQYVDAGSVSNVTVDEPNQVSNDDAPNAIPTPASSIDPPTPNFVNTSSIDDSPEPTASPYSFNDQLSNAVVQGKKCWEQ